MSLVYAITRYLSRLLLRLKSALLLQIAQKYGRYRALVILHILRMYEYVRVMCICLVVLHSIESIWLAYML